MKKATGVARAVVEAGAVDDDCALAVVIVADLEGQLEVVTIGRERVPARILRATLALALAEVENAEGMLVAKIERGKA